MGYYVCDKLWVVRISRSIESFDSSFLVLFLYFVLSNVEAHVDYMDDIILFNYTGRYSCAK